ncbi:MAG: ExbD/TolR family protein [Sphingomonas sp.]
MAMSGGRDDGEPMMEMNTTPLIDVMLVLLIMFIITIPPQTHAVKVDLPQNNQNQQVVQPDKNKITIDPTGQVAWNGTPVDDITLRQYLDASLQLPTEPELHFQPDPQARYEKVDEVLAIIKRSGVTKMGFIGNEQYRNDF